ncbi:MAG: ABC transporter permease [Solirubrobacteraceae bacterium]
MTAITPGIDAITATERKRLAQRTKLRQAKRRRRILMWSVRLLSLLVVLVAWQVYGSSVNPVLFAPPTTVAHEFVAMTSDGTLPTAFLESIRELAIGLAGAIVIGIPLALWWARSDILDWAIQGYINALYATPLVAIVPLLVLWFGFGLKAKVVIVFLFAVFPIMLSTYEGAHSVDRELLEVARSFGSSEMQTWRHVVLPSSVPFIAAGLNIGVGRALVGMIIAEFYTSAGGLGYIVLAAGNTFQTAKMFAPIIVVMALGVVLLGATRTIKLKVAPWSEQEGRL